uniref:Uncharacterized protein n=1 Tax=Anguilla anguilla TaxID=7936 RepID=A0A0E9TMB6_ANGAN
MPPAVLKVLPTQRLVSWWIRLLSPITAFRVAGTASHSSSRLTDDVSYRNMEFRMSFFWRLHLLFIR